MASLQRSDSVLVADDDVLLRRLVKECLRSCGCDVRTCADGDDMLRAYEPGRHTLLILDVMMPRKTGIEALREIRARGDRVPAVVMTSLPEEEIRPSLPEIGKVALLPKPFGPQELREAIDHVLATCCGDMESESGNAAGASGA